MDELLYLDLDSTIIETHGLAKEGAFFGYTKVRGHHPLIARVSEPGQPGWIAPYSRHTASRCTGSPARFRRGTPPPAGVARISWPRRCTFYTLNSEEPIYCAAAVTLARTR